MTFAQATGDSDVTRFVLQVVALITGGGIVQLVVFLLRRRSEITALDKTSSAPLLASANELIARLEASELRSSQKVETLTGRLAHQEEMSTEALRVAHDENRRLAAEVAQHRIDLDICQRQVEQLRRQLAIYQQGGNTGPWTGGQ